MLGTKAAYAAWASQYIELLGDVESMSSIDRQTIAQWASTVGGLIVDAGCGPGHWAQFMHELGADVEGFDMVPEFIDSARSRFASVRFQQGTLENLPYDSGSVAGILSWYSVIHTEPEKLQEILKEFARCLAPGGTLLIGFFEGSQVTAFDHAVARAYFWPVKEMVRQLEKAGFSISGVRTRTDNGSRPHADIVAGLEGVPETNSD